jgi:hypothetical protein
MISIEDGISLDLITDFTKSYAAGLSSGITRFTINLNENYTEGLLALLDDHVDLAM